MEGYNKNRVSLKKNLVLFLCSIMIVMGISFLLYSMDAYASITIGLQESGDSDGAMGALEILFLLMALALMPSVIIMMTSFTRIIIVLSFLRNALGTQQSPPNQIIIGLALFLTLFIMNPVIEEINTTAFEPYGEGEITSEEAIDRAIIPLKIFMLKQTNRPDLDMFITLSGVDVPTNADGETQLEELGLTVIVPSFITSEIKRAFTIGFLIFIPFLIIDMVVASTLMSMGMVMLPPAVIALPFKIMIFVVIDGWGLMFRMLVKGVVEKL